MKSVGPQFSISPEPGEQVLLMKEFRGSHNHVFAMAVSNQALYVSKLELGFRNGGWSMKRLELAEVENVSLLRQRPLYLFGLSGVMILFGSFTSVMMMWRVLNPMPGMEYRVSGWPFAIALAGMLIPFISRGRRILVVRSESGKFKWKPQLSIDKKTRSVYTDMQNEILETCERVGIATSKS